MSHLNGVSAGITGHQDLQAKAWVRERLRELIDSECIAVGITSLARGADQLFAECLLEAGRRFRLVLPSKHYEEAFGDATSRAAYKRLRAQAADVEALQFDEPSESAFFAAGKHIADVSDLLVAVWDGAPAKGLGGTGDVVAYALSKGKRVIHVDCVKHSVSTL